MSVPVISTPDMDEVESELTTLLYMQRVNFEAADDIADRARPLWKEVYKTRISDVATTPEGRGATRNLYTRKWDASGTVFDRTRALAPFLQPDMWPEFHHDEESKKKHIDIWTELIGLSAEAAEAYDAIRACSRSMVSPVQTAQGLARSDAAEARGWYATLSTSRRSTTGWIVGGRGNTIHIVEDPLLRVWRITADADHSLRLTDKRMGQMLCNHHVSALPTEVEKYSFKTANLTLIYPPDMAADRKEWVTAVLPKVEEAREKAKPIHATFMEWKEKADPLIAKDEVYTRWMKGLPSTFADWTKDGGQMRWIHGAAETMAVLLHDTGLNDEVLRKAVVAEYQRRHPENILSAADRALVNARPAGDESLSNVTASILEKEYPGLAPMF